MTDSTDSGDERLLRRDRGRGQCERVADGPRVEGLGRRGHQLEQRPGRGQGVQALGGGARSYKMYDDFSN